VAIESGHDSRREPAEAALAVIEENGLWRLPYRPAPSSKPSRVARTRAPIVSTT
jgi:hypothetical protein